LAGTSKEKKAVGRNRLKWEAITEMDFVKIIVHSSVLDLSGLEQGPEIGS